MWLIAALIFVLLVGGLFGGAWFFLRHLIYGEWRGVRWTPEDFGLNGEWVEFESLDGSIICSYKVSPKKPAAWVVVVHGFNPTGGFVGAAEFWPYAKKFVGAGYGVLVLDLPGFGLSPRRTRGYHLGFLEWWDVVAACEYLRFELEVDLPVGLLAKSAGTPAATVAAAKGCADFVVLESAIASFGLLMVAQLQYHGLPKMLALPLAAVLNLVWRYGFDHSRVIDPIDIAGKIDVPILFLRGGQDPEVLEEDTLLLAEEIGHLATVKKFAAAGHNILRQHGGPKRLINEDEARKAWEEVLAFLEDVKNGRR